MPVCLSRVSEETFEKITSPDIGVFWFLLIFGEHVMSYLIYTDTDTHFIDAP